MITRLLIANRGEIAVRIARTCRRLGIQTVAVYSDADAGHPFLRAADQALALGGSQPHESYLSADKILAAAMSTGCDAVHPGYGFLSENVAFAERVEQSGIRFVGPAPETIRSLGGKDQARLMAAQLGIPTPPGYEGADQSIGALTEQAELIGYPILIKAAAGGGGRGMRRVNAAPELASALESAKREALSSFSDDRLILEKLILGSRHIEVQLLGDGFGKVLHFYERDCSWQRRYQKVLEEAPASNLATKLRDALIADAVRLAAHAKLRSAATAEFLVSTETQQHYFWRLIPRLQVEHPITECITGVDLVELQLAVASGKPLELRQEEITVKGCAIEARVCAELPELGFIPSTGRLLRLSLPEQEAGALRIDHGLGPGMAISPYYDSLLAKVIGVGATHSDARSRLQDALDAVCIEGVGTNTGFLKGLLDWTVLQSEVHTADLELKFTAPQLQTDLEQVAQSALCAQAAFEWFEARNRAAAPQFFLSSQLDGNCSDALGVPASKKMFQARCPNLGRPLSAAVEVTNICYQLPSCSPEFAVVKGKIELGADSPVDWTAIAGSTDSAGTPGILLEVAIGGDADAVPVQIAQARLDEYGYLASVLSINGYTFAVGRLPAWENARQAENSGGNQIRAPLPGTIVKVLVATGDSVKHGDVLVVLESMKMEHALRAPADATVDSIEVSQQSTVQRGDLLVSLLLL